MSDVEGHKCNHCGKIVMEINNENFWLHIHKGEILGKMVKKKQPDQLKSYIELSMVDFCSIECVTKYMTITNDDLDKEE